MAGDFNGKPQSERRVEVNLLGMAPLSAIIDSVGVLEAAGLKLWHALTDWLAVGELLHRHAPCLLVPWI